MKVIFSIIFILSLSIKVIFAATLTAQPDINPVLLSDSFHLTYMSSGKVDGVPNFDPIKKDFEILGTQQSKNISMINGNFQQNTSWVLTLIAKSTGTFIIPPISFGADQAPEVKVIVKDSLNSSSATPSQDFFVELEASTKSAFTQQQIIITARLYISKSISSYQFGELTTDNPDTQIVTLTKGQQYKTYKCQKQFIVVEQKFALYPTESGKLKINRFIAEISMESRSSRARFFDPFNTNTVSKRIVSKPLILTINAIPSLFKGDNWLPSTSVKLKDEWPKNKKFIAGDPITRTITLTAEGVSSTLLTEIKQKQIDGLKQYPDKPVTDENKSEMGIRSSLKQKIAYIPTHAGSYTLPAITIPWWNVNKNKIELAHIAERSFTVYPGNQNNINQTPIIKQPDNTVSHKQIEVPELNIKDTSAKLKQTTSTASPVWFWLSLLFFILWLLTAILWWKSKTDKTSAKEKQAQDSLSLAKSLNNIKTSCQNNNAAGTKSALLNWAKQIFPAVQINNLSDLAKQLDDGLALKIEQLNTHLYSASDSNWECNGIYQLCKNIKPAHKHKTKKSNAAELETFNRQ